jgi:hypothetical protein
VTSAIDKSLHVAVRQGGTIRHTRPKARKIKAAKSICMDRLCLVAGGLLSRAAASNLANRVKVR